MREDHTPWGDLISLLFRAQAWLAMQSRRKAERSISARRHKMRELWCCSTLIMTGGRFQTSPGSKSAWHAIAPGQQSRRQRFPPRRDTHDPASATGRGTGTAIRPPCL